MRQLVMSHCDLLGEMLTLARKEGRKEALVCKTLAQFLYACPTDAPMMTHHNYSLTSRRTTDTAWRGVPLTTPTVHSSPTHRPLIAHSSPSHCPCMRPNGR